VFLLYWLIAFLSGAGVLVVEVAATRALNPFFGQSTFVWTNVIGLILLGLSVGNVVGGRLADRTRSPALLGVLLVIASVLVGVSGWLTGPVARWILPADLPLEAAYGFLVKGSFLAAFACFFLPVALLGAVFPFLVRCASREIGEVGARSGALAAASTLGSIAGTFLTAHLLLWTLGTRGTLLAAGAALMLAAGLLFIAGRRRANAWAAVVLAVAGGAAAASPAARAAVSGAAMGRLIEARETRYQHVEVRARDDLPVPANVLTIDEGLDSFQSVTPAEGTLTGGLYYDAFTMLALARPADRPLEVLVLGMGAGTHVRQLLDVVGSRRALSIVAVELDPGVVAIARERLRLAEDPRLAVVTDVDARPYVAHARKRFDFIIVDCYAQQSFLPPHVASVEFFEAVRDRLADGGEVAFNAFGYGASDPVVEQIVQVLVHCFPNGVVVAAVPRSASFVVYADRDGRAQLPSRWSTASWPEPLQRLASSMGRPGAAWYAERDPRIDPVRDDDGRLERVQWKRLSEHADRLLGSLR
jgi:spermidine synthase